MSISPDTFLPPGLAPREAGDPAAIGPYRVVGRIGSGGMGAVYGALDVYGRCVAVKTVHAGFARQPRFREAFAREVEMLGRADGVSTARLHAADTGAEVPWLAFDYVPGRDLRAHVREFGPLEGGMLRTFALGTAEGLAALHAAGIAHRDIKPGNVILSPDGPKIVDFGIAVEIGTERAMDGSASYGTPGWSAPERYSGAVADPAADVFAWGGLVVLAVTGHQPFGSGEGAELARRVREGEYDVDGVPGDLLGLVEAALSVDPEQRPSSEELVGALLPEAEEGPEGQAGRPQTTADSLRRMLGDYWRGVDDAGHDPARWATALGVASGAGLGVSALASGAGGSGLLGSGGGAGTATASASGATANAASGGAAGTSVSSGGVLSGVATSKLGLAGAGVLAVAGLAAGAFVVYDQVSENPSETVAAAATILEEGQGFTARVERAFSQAHAEEVSEGTGVPVDQVVEDSRVEEEYLYSAQGQTFLIRGEVMGPGTTAVANHQGELYVYAPREEDNAARPRQESPERLEPAPGVSADSVSAALVTAPLRALAESGGAEAVERQRVYAGPTVFGLLDGGALVEGEATGRVELDEEGAPVRAEYTTDRWEVGVDFEAVDAEVPREDPQVWAADNDGFGWAVVHAPLCGATPWEDRQGTVQEWSVQASGWDMDCDYAMDVAGQLEEPDRDGERFAQLNDRVFGVVTVLIDGTMACAGPNTYGPCQEVTVGFTRDDGGTVNGFDELDLSPVTLIDFHEQS